MRSLAGALNAMLARLNASTTALRRFAADTGHELRTPLTSLRANLDALERNPDLPVEERTALLRESTAEQERIVHLLDGLTALARGEAGDALPREDVEMADLVDAAVYAARRRHPAVTYELVGGDRGRAAARLGERAAAAGRQPARQCGLHGGGLVRVDLAQEPTGGLLLRVADNGPGIPPEDRDRLLERFARGDGTGAPGTGLGLAIVAQQVALHGGSLSLGDSDLGGLEADVRLRGTGEVIMADNRARHRDPYVRTFDTSPASLLYVDVERVAIVLTPKSGSRSGCSSAIVTYGRSNAGSTVRWHARARAG